MPTRFSFVSAFSSAVLASTVAVSSGCTSNAAPSVALSPPPGHAKPVAAPTDLNRTLCLSPVLGAAPTTATASMLSAAQAKVVSPETKATDDSAAPASAQALPDQWVTIGNAWVARARDESDPGGYLHAASCAKLALEGDKRHRGAQNLLLLTLLNDHRFSEAKDLATAVLAADPDDQSSWGSLSDALLELGDIAGATDAAQKMVDLKPNLPSYARASYLAWLQGDRVAAKVYIRQAHASGRGQRLREPEAWVLTQAALLFWHEGDLDGALAGFNLALKKRAEFPDALVGKGQIALARGQGQEAAGLFARAYAKKPAVLTAWLLGDAHTLAGNKDEAAAAYATVRQSGRAQDPRTFGLFLATRSTNVDDHALAVKLLQQEFEARPGPYTSTAYAVALAQVGRAKEALPLVTTTIALGTPDATLLSRAAFVQGAAGLDAERRALTAKAEQLNRHLARPPTAL